MWWFYAIFFCWKEVRLGLIHWELRKGDWQGHSNNERAVWEGERGGAGLSDIRDVVLPRSRTPLWSYTPRCICSWFSEGRGMGQRVILLKTIQGNFRVRKTAETYRERERMRRDWLKWTERQKMSGRRDRSEMTQRDYRWERKRRQMGGDRSRQIKQTERERWSAGDKDQ